MPDSSMVAVVPIQVCQTRGPAGRTTGRSTRTASSASIAAIFFVPNGASPYRWVHKQPTGSLRRLPLPSPLIHHFRGLYTHQQVFFTHFILTYAHRLRHDCIYLFLDSQARVPDGFLWFKVTPSFYIPIGRIYSSI